MNRWRFPTARQVRHLLIVSLVLAAYPAAAETNENGVTARPADSGLEERAEVRLAQIEVSVSGDPEIVANLIPADFHVRVDGEEIENFLLDRLVVTGPEGTIPPVTYMFYFDQAMLTSTGWHGSLQLARELVQRLIDDRSRGIVASGGQNLRFHSDLTSDVSELMQAFARLEADTRNLDFYAIGESARIAVTKEATRVAIAAERRADKP